MAPSELRHRMRVWIPVGVLVVCISVLAFVFSPTDPIAFSMEWGVWLAVGLGSYFWEYRLGSAHKERQQDL